MSTSPHELGWTKIKKVISRHLLSTTEDTHLVGLQGVGSGLGIYGAEQGMGFVSSNSENCAQSAQQRYSSYQYALHVTVLLMLPSTVSCE